MLGVVGGACAWQLTYDPHQEHWYIVSDLPQLLVKHTDLDHITK